MRANALLYRYFRAPSRNAKVHLGPGREKYLNGWINVDANLFTAKTDVWASLLDPLPFRDRSVDVFYSHHVIEHLPDAHLPVLFREMFRALRVGGGVRIAAPHLGNACRKYVEGDLEWFSDYPDARASIGGRFMNFLFCRGEHVTALDESYLAEIAMGVGFGEIAFSMPTRDTVLTDLGIDEHVFASEWESDYDCPHTVVLEARKI